MITCAAAGDSHLDPKINFSSTNELRFVAYLQGVLETFFPFSFLLCNYNFEHREKSVAFSRF